MNPYPSAIVWSNAEGGTNGTTVTTANSGGVSGTAFSGTQRTGTTILAFTNSSIHDTMSYRIVPDGSGYANLRWYTAALGGVLGIVAGAMYVSFDNLSAIASSATFALGAGDDTDANLIYRIRVTNAGVLQLANAVTTNNIASASGGVMTSATTHRVEWLINHATGDYTLELFVGDATTALASASGTSASLIAVGTGQVRFGGITTAAWAATFDSMAIGTVKLGPRVGSNQPPTVDAGEDQAVSSYDEVTLNATVSDPNTGDTITTTWSQTGGIPTVTLNGMGEVCTFTAPATRGGTTLVFTATASDGTASASDTVSVVVYPHNEWAAVTASEVPIHTKIASNGSLI